MHYKSDHEIDPVFFFKMTLNPRKIPVFVFPTSLKFYLSTRSTHKQLLTLYNPYEFSVKFKVLSTAPNKYSVIDPDGSIGPQSCVDIVIRHNAPSSVNCNVVDKFRIAMQDQQTHQQMGKRDIEAILLDCDKDGISNDGDFHNIAPSEINDGVSAVKYPMFAQRAAHIPNSNIYIILVIGLLSTIVLCLPSVQDEKNEVSSFIPKYLHLNIQIKYIASYILGLVTTALLKAF